MRLQGRCVERRCDAGILGSGLSSIARIDARRRLRQAICRYFASSATTGCRIPKLLYVRASVEGDIWVHEAQAEQLPRAREPNVGEVVAMLARLRLFSCEGRRAERSAERAAQSGSCSQM